MGQNPLDDLDSLGEFSQFIPSSGKLDLGWGKANESVRSELATLDSSSSAESDYYRCCVSAVWLFQNFLDESHSISQEIHSAEGSYLHGIMHRREGDYSNAKYWFRKAGLEGFFEILESWIAEDPTIEESIKQQFALFDPFRLVDAVESNRDSTESLERLTYLELLAVTQHCYQQI